LGTGWYPISSTVLRFSGKARSRFRSTAIQVDGQPITGVTGNTAMIQSRFGRQGNFEMLVPAGGQLVHFFRANDEPGFPWHRAPELPGSANALGAALIESNFGGPGNLEVVARLGDGLVSYFFDGTELQWRGPFPIQVDGQSITGVTGF